MPIETVTNTPADNSLAVRLSEMEAWARKGYDLSAADTLELIGLLRQYMAHAETIERSVEAMTRTLSSAGL